MSEIVSKHMWRRTAQAEERRLENDDPGNQYKVEKAVRPRFFGARWYVVKLPYPKHVKRTSTRKNSKKV